jgi:hypothetical protein
MVCFADIVVVVVVVKVIFIDNINYLCNALTPPREEKVYLLLSCIYFNSAIS